MFRPWIFPANFPGNVLCIRESAQSTVDSQEDLGNHHPDLTLAISKRLQERNDRKVFPQAIDIEESNCGLSSKSTIGECLQNLREYFLCRKVLSSTHCSIGVSQAHRFLVH